MTEHSLRGEGVRRVQWSQVLSWVVLAGCLGISIAVATVRYSFVDAQQRDQFATSVASVDAIVSTRLARQEDLLHAVVGMVSATPDMTNPQFAQWYAAAEVAQRFPGGIGVSYLERVPAADLPAFAARQDADPVTGLTSLGSFTVYPDSPAPEYCLAHLAVWEVDTVNGFVIPPGLDFCAPEITPGEPSLLGGALHQATVEAAVALVPISELTPGLLAVLLPVYGTSEVPSTPEQREQAVVGWTAASFDAAALLDPAAGQAGLQVSIDRRIEGSVDRIATVGSLEGGPVSTEVLPILEDGTWTVTVAQSEGSRGLSARDQALVVLLVGSMVSLLLFALLRVLATSRTRALAMVAEKTEQLAYQTFHDTLTGLPNRALIEDRAAQLLANQARTGEALAVLFVDLDDFKTVNDTLGHAAGDAYLRIVADRLTGLVRSTDTVGRFGGDEFVVLLGEGAGGEAPEEVARRILEGLSMPIDLEGASIAASCSVGVAVGPRDTLDELLVDADRAMYEAKEAGKGALAVARATAAPEG